MSKKNTSSSSCVFVCVCEYSSCCEQWGVLSSFINLTGCQMGHMHVLQFRSQEWSFEVSYCDVKPNQIYIEMNRRSWNWDEKEAKGTFSCYFSFFLFYSSKIFCVKRKLFSIPHFCLCVCVCVCVFVCATKQRIAIMVCMRVLVYVCVCVCFCVCLSGAHVLKDCGANEHWLHMNEILRCCWRPPSTLSGARCFCLCCVIFNLLFCPLQTKSVCVNEHIVDLFFPRAAPGHTTSVCVCVCTCACMYAGDDALVDYTGSAICV